MQDILEEKPPLRIPASIYVVSEVCSGHWSPIQSLFCRRPERSTQTGAHAWLMDIFPFHQNGTIRSRKAVNLTVNNIICIGEGSV